VAFEDCSTRLIFDRVSLCSNSRAGRDNYPEYIHSICVYAPQPTASVLGFLWTLAKGPQGMSSLVLGALVVAVPDARQAFSVFRKRSQADSKRKRVISGRTLNRTRSKWPTPRLMYIRRWPFNSKKPAVYFRFRTGSRGGGRNGGLHCPPWV